jgi:molecular chaperone Hsp33
MRGSSPDQLLLAVAADGALTLRVLVATALVGEAQRRHSTAPTASAALGRALMGAVLLVAGREEEETVQIQLRGDGDVGQVTAIADGVGAARGYVHNPAAHPPPRGSKLDVGRAVGRGVLAVVRYHPSWREPYSGIVPIVSGEVAEDLAHYLAESEQTPSALAAGVFVAADGSIEQAGAYLVQAQPHAPDEALEQLERTVAALPSPTELLRQGLDAQGMLERLADGLDPRVLEEGKPRFLCRCSRDRMRQAVVLLGRDETREISAAGESLEVRCEFCADSYTLDADEVGSLIPDA